MNEELAEIQVIKQDIKYMSEKIVNIQSDVDKLYKKTNQIPDLNTSIQLLNSTVSRLQVTVDKMTEQPSKRWDNIISVGIGAIVTGLVTFVLIRLGLK